MAKQTGFSAPTISKALNGNGKLSDETRQTIVEAAKKAGYTANMAAKALSTKHSRLIGVILEDVSMQRGFEHPLFGGLLNKFRKEIELAGYDLLFLSKHFNEGMSYIDHCRYRDVEGILIVNPIDDDEEMKTLGTCGIPCVSTNEFIPGVCTVVTDNENAGQIAARVLYEAGHEKIGFLGAPFRENSPAALERYKGFKAELESYGKECDEKYLEVCSAWWDGAGYEGMKKLYERCPDITAVFVVCDALAFGAMKYLLEIGKSIPNDISVIGFDDDTTVLKAAPTLCTFRQDRDKIAQLASEVLLQGIAGVPNPEIVRVPAEYIQRGSVRSFRRIHQMAY
ncbi:MAG: LacI family DNA-binding transcriptional regulator [Treponema sp.]|nr:LacI family DNA-binding transcriptional regulator [Treponema sp.]MEE3434108.1 LacI family DNA-binding transcriptional regulator [Treponema sp.]